MNDNYNNNNNPRETWSSERVKELTMSKITPKRPMYKKISRPLLTIAACLALVLSMGITALATDAFGIRSFFAYNWVVSDDGQAIELNVEDGVFAFGAGVGPYSSRMDVSSINLSPSRLSLSYIYCSEDFEARKPWGVFLLMSDHSFIYIEMTDYSIDGNIFTGSGEIYPAVNLYDVSEVKIWHRFGERGELGHGSSGISVHGFIDHHDWFIIYQAMLEFLEGLD